MAGGSLEQPVLFVKGEMDGICASPAAAWESLCAARARISSVTSLPAGHWLPLERKAELTQAILAWLGAKGLSQGTQHQ